MNKEDKKLLTEMIQLYVRTNLDKLKNNGREVYDLQIKINNNFKKLEEIQSLLKK